MVFMVYILSRIVDKFFILFGNLAVDEHLHLALLGPDHHRLAAHAPDHVERVHRPAPQRQLQGVFLNPLLKGLFQIAGDLEEPVRRAQPADALVGALVVVILDPQGAALCRFLEAAKLRPLEKLTEDRLPEPLDLAQRHRMVRTRPDMFDPVLFHLALKARLSPPVGVLPAVVGEHLPRHPVFGHRTAVGLEHLGRGLAPVEPQGRDVARVIVDKADQIRISSRKSEGHDVALPHLVGAGPLEEPRLGGVPCRLAPTLFRQPPRGELAVDRRGAGRHQKKAPQHIGDPARAVVRMTGFNVHHPLTDLRRHPASAATGARLGVQPLVPVIPVSPNPPLNRMRADAKLLGQKQPAVALFQVQANDSKPKLKWVGMGAGRLLASSAGRRCLGIFHQVHSFLCSRFLHSGVSPNFLTRAVS
ncbi:MAG: hypothetical protein R6X05_04230 [Desulfobacterales bacterium]